LLSSLSASTRFPKRMIFISCVSIWISIRWVLHLICFSQLSYFF